MFDKYLCKRFHEKCITFGMIADRYIRENPLVNEILCVLAVIDIAFIISVALICGIILCLKLVLAVMLTAFVLGIATALADDKIVAVCPLSKKPEQ